MARLKKIAVTEARALAFNVLWRVEAQGAYSDVALDAALRASAGLDGRERALATQLVYGVLRQRGRLDFVLSHLCRQPLSALEMAVLLLLRLGAYQLLYLDRVPERAAVHSTVELARRLGLERATGLVNAVLRGCIRRRDEITCPDPAAGAEQMATGCSLPLWLARRWLRQYDVATAVALAQCQSEAAPVTLRVNTLKVERRQVLEELQRHGAAAAPTRFAAEGITVSGGGIAVLQQIDPSWYQLQDEASMLIAPLLQPQPGERIADVCAAPGGKTTHLAALCGDEASISASDIHASRLKTLQRAAQRLGCGCVKTLRRDMTATPASADSGSFHKVLVDAPCSGLGVLRRNPEVRWRRQEEDVTRLALLQRKILANAAEMLAPGGLLVYSLCTTTVEESWQVVDDFLAHHTDYELVPVAQLAPPHWQQLCDKRGALSTFTPWHDNMDCFFAVVLRRING